MLRSILKLALLAAIAICPAFADDIAVQFVNQWGSFCNGVGVAGNYAIAGNGSDLIAFDASDPSSLVEVGRITLSDTVGYIVIVGDEAYVLTGRGTMHIVDISDPANMLELGSISFPSGKTPPRVDIAGQYAYFVNGGNAMKIIDISDPANLRVVGEYKKTTYGVCVRDNCAFVSVGPAFQTVDVSDPTSPKLLGTCGTDPAALAITIVGDSDKSFACLAGYGGFATIDVSNRASPKQLGALGGEASAVMAAGDYAYVATDYGLGVENIADPSKPHNVGRFSAEDAGAQLQLVGDHAFLADGRGGMKVIDVSDPANMTALWSDAVGRIHEIRVDDSLAYCVTAAPNLAIVDLHDVLHPTVRSFYGAHGDALYDVFVDRGYAYLSRGDSFEIVDTSNPQSPRQIGVYKRFLITSSVVIDDYAYLAGSVFDVLDIHDRTTPTHIGSITLNSPAKHLRIEAPYAYLTTSARGLTVVDFSVPKTPKTVAQLAGYAGALDVQSPYAYAMTANREFDVIDISTPKNPTRVGRLQLDSDIYELSVRNGFAYLAADTGGLAIVDVSDPVNPRRVGGFATSGALTSIALDGQYAHLTDVDHGITTLWIAATADLNCDRTVDFDDIDAFVLALVGRQDYEQTYANCGYLQADINRDGLVDMHDIDGFVECLVNNGCR